MKRILIILTIILLTACSSGTYGKATDVRNDTTDNWKKVVTSKKFEVEEALNYYDEYMSDGEIHFVISFATNTTTVIRDLGDFMSVTVHEYEDKEEHDATTIGNGMELAEYIVHYDGEVEEVE